MLRYGGYLNRIFTGTYLLIPQERSRTVTTLSNVLQAASCKLHLHVTTKSSHSFELYKNNYKLVQDHGARCCEIPEGFLGFYSDSVNMNRALTLTLSMSDNNPRGWPSRKIVLGGTIAIFHMNGRKARGLIVICALHHGQRRLFLSLCCFHIRKAHSPHGRVCCTHCKV